MVICLVAGRSVSISPHRRVAGGTAAGDDPVSVRTEEERGTFGNKVSAMIVPLPTHIDDPAERLEFIHSVMGAARTVTMPFRRGPA